MEPNDELKIKDLIYRNSAGTVKKELMADMNGVLDGLSASVFLPLTDVPLGNESRVLDIEDIFEKFRTNVSRKILQNFDAMWETNGMTESVACLECLKQETSNKSAVQWRPTGKTPREQIRPYVVKTLQKKCSYLDKQHAYQENLFDEYVPKVLETRQRIESLIANRSVLLDLISVHQKQLQEEIGRKQIPDRCNEMLDEILE